MSTMRSTDDSDVDSEHRLHSHLGIKDKDSDFNFFWKRTQISQLNAEVNVKLSKQNFVCYLIKFYNVALMPIMCPHFQESC